MRVSLVILLITFMVSFQGKATARAEPSWFPFSYPCDTEWVEGDYEPNQEFGLSI